MAQAATYEIHTLHGDRWLIDAVLDNKENALSEARSMFADPHLMGIKVIAEIINEDNGQASCRTLFNQRRDQVRRKPAPRAAQKEHVRVHDAAKKPERKNSASVTKAMVSLMGIAAMVLVLLGAGIYFID